MKQEGAQNFRKEGVLCSRIGRQSNESKGKESIMRTNKASITNPSSTGERLTLVNVPIVMKVSFFFFEPSLGP
jgi:hypothetical protein